MGNWSITTELTNTQLNILLDKIKELYRINSGKDDDVTCIINNDNILLYSYVGSDINDIKVFKNFILNTDDILIFKSELKEPFTFIISNSKKFVRSLSNFTEYTENIKINFQINDTNYVNAIGVYNDKLKARVTGGDPITLKNNITIDIIEQLTNVEKSKFHFNVDPYDFQRIKKMSLIDSNNDVMYINVQDGIVSIGENKWELNVDKIEIENYNTLTFPKRYFGAISTTDVISVYIFESHILLKSSDSNLLIVLEFTV